jgi:glycosyltransferase involved in cell wall biosynthesis
VRFLRSQNEFGDLPEPFDSRTYKVNDRDGWLALAQKGGVIGVLDGSLWDDGWTPEAAIVVSDYVGARLVLMANPETRAAFEAIPTFHYVPVEGVDLPPVWAEMWRSIQPVAMSEFGADQIARITGARPPVIYHGVDATTFRPVSPENPLYLNDAKLRDKAACKRFFGGDPRQRWILRTDRHMPRKRYGSFLRSMVPVIAQRPDTFLVIHCRSTDQGGNLYDTLSKYPKAIQSRVLLTGFHDQAGGASREILTALYNAADLYVSVSAEGFGLTIAEAIACGTPALGLDYSAVPEVIGPAGELLPIGGLIDNEYDHFWAAVDERKAAEITGRVLDDPNLLAKYGRAGPAHVRANFSWRKAAEQFSAAIREAMEVRLAA